MTVQGGTGTGVGLITVLLGGATGTAAIADPGASKLGTAPIAAAVSHPLSALSRVPAVLAYTGANDVGLLIVAAAVLLLAGLLLAGLSARHRAGPGRSRGPAPQA